MKYNTVLLIAEFVRRLEIFTAGLCAMIAFFLGLSAVGAAIDGISRAGDIGIYAAVFSTVTALFALASFNLGRWIEEQED